MKIMHQIFFIKNGTSIFVNKKKPIKKTINGFKLWIRKEESTIFYKVGTKYIPIEDIYSSEISAKHSKSQLLESIRSEKIFEFVDIFLFIRPHGQYVYFKLEDGRETLGFISEATIEIDEDTVCVSYSVKSLISEKVWSNLLDSDLKEVD